MTAAFFLLLLSSLFGAPDVPVAAIVLLAMVPLAAYRPAAALLAVAALVPVASWAGRHWSGAVAWPETIAVVYLAGYAARRTLDVAPKPATGFTRAIHAMVAVVVASLAVEFLFLHATLGGPSMRHMLWQWLSSDYFIGDGGFDNGDAAMRIIEGLLLALAATTYARGDAEFGPRLARALVIGAAMAAGLTLWRLWLGALRADDAVLTFLRYLGTLRFNAHYADVNAAGSYYVMALLPALALAWIRKGWLVAPILIALALALTGSRAAFVAAPAAVALAWFRVNQGTFRRHSMRTVWLTAAALLVLVSAGIFLGANARNVTPVSRALEFRKEFTMTSLRMIGSSPVFGVGVGEYHEASADFASAKLRAVYPNENAHNNFLQLLA